MIMSRFSRFAEYLLRQRPLQHLAFWLLSFYVLARHFAYEDTVHRADIIYTLLFHLSLWLAVYANLLLLIPKLLQARRYLWYLLAITALLLAATYFNIFTFDVLAGWLFPDYYFISYFSYGELLQYHLVYLAITSLLKLSRGWFELQRQEKRISRLEKERARAELKALKSQIDPHFLFNILNNLYSQALEESPRVPEAILRLSECMRYMLYDCRGEYVPLEKELEYIDNYIELQRLRLRPEARVEWTASGEPEGLQIPPLIFIPFVENGFKHGLRGQGQPPFVEISLVIEQGELYFSMQNDKAPTAEDLPEREQGIGLDNVRKRLNLLYPGRHQLNILETETSFSVNLKITKPCPLPASSSTTNRRP